MIKKFGKSLHDIFGIKEAFINQNKELLKENLLLAQVAQQQPKRENCKNCSTKLTNDPLFTKQGIHYFLCEQCNHLNGEFQDTNEFAKAVYVDEVTSYSKNYSASDKEKWNERVEKIYNPKADFLSECLGKDKLDKNMSILDIGAGSGYFLKALMNHGFNNIQGCEVSSVQTQFANSMLQREVVKEIEIDALGEIVSNTHSEIISMIGVLEHLTNPRQILKAISRNKNIKYYYLSLPLFSFSAFFELSNENYFNRHLSGGHTHLYTKESIEYFSNEFGFEIMGQWFFGADAMDLFRFSLLKMSESEVNRNAAHLFSDKFLEIIDEVQIAFDKAEFSSEVHLLLKNNLV